MITITINVDGQPVQDIAVAAQGVPVAAQGVPVADAPKAPARHAVTWLKPLDFRLTERQIAVVRLAATGMQYKQVADELGISERTVRSHMTEIFNRTGIRSNAMLVAWAWLMGLINEDDIMASWRDIAPHLVRIA